MIKESEPNKNIRTIIIAMLAMIFLPYWGGYLYVHGHFPQNYFQFPPLQPEPKAPFNSIVFGVGLCLMAGFILFYTFPRIFGFKKVPPPSHPVMEQQQKPKVSLPYWFWMGLITWGGTLCILWTHAEQPVAIIHWAALFLFWGFTFVLDGIVYVRTGGISLITNRPREVIGIGIASISGWLLFEFLNFFVDDNWCYPFGNILPTSEFVIYAVVGSSGLMPMALEWYSLLNTFEKFRYKYSYGPKIIMPEWLKTVLIVGSFIAMFFIPFFPNLMFAALWVAPMFILTAVLSKLKIWTPFTAINEGNWSPLAITALTFGIQGFLCECWNYFSGVHSGAGITTHNPDYWTYSIPFIDKYHVFEMPLLGLMGYLPFGVYCGVWWVAFAYLLNIETHFFDDASKSISER